MYAKAMLTAAGWVRFSLTLYVGLIKILSSYSLLGILGKRSVNICEFSLQVIPMN